jgi:hypothetical protein
MSLSRSEQARINGAKSRGPKTERGKAISSLNALKHGRFAKHTTILFFESSDDYNQILDDLTVQFRPATNNERCLVEQLASTQLNHARAQLALTTYIERLFRYASADRLEIPPTSNPMDILVAAEEEALTRSPYLKFKSRQISQFLIDQNRINHAIKTCKRDFPAVAPEPEPAHLPDPEFPELVETSEDVEFVGNVDIFPKPRTKSTTSTPPCPFKPLETNPAVSYPCPHKPLSQQPADPPTPLPEAA